jgi:hypothetical protein
MTTLKLTPLLNEIIFRTIIESVGGDAGKIENETDKLEQELKDAGTDADSEEVQAAMLGALIDADGDVEQLDVSDVESIAKDIKESRGYVLTESGVMMAGIEAIGTVLGNAALLNAIAAKVEKISGKKVNVTQLKTKIEKITARIKNITGWPAKKMEQAFAWIAKKFGGGAFAQKIAGYAGTLVAVITMFIIGVIYFPSIGSGVLFIFSIAGLMGKGAEMIKLVKEIIHAIKEEMAKNDPSSSPELST